MPTSQIEGPEKTQTVLTQTQQITPSGVNFACIPCTVFENFSGFRSTSKA